MTDYNASYEGDLRARRRRRTAHAGPKALTDTVGSLRALTVDPATARMLTPEEQDAILEAAIKAQDELAMIEQELRAQQRERTDGEETLGERAA